MQSFKINQMCFDRQAKEMVQISNGIEDASGNLTPTEAISLRVFIGKDGNAQIYYTHRKVSAEFLTPNNEHDGNGHGIGRLTDNKKPTAKFFGRI